MNTPWRIELLGRLRATHGERVVTRFRARRTGALFAYLAYHLDRPHPREALIELLWPEAEPQTGRNNLRRELTSLRRQLEPPGVPAGAVLIADRGWIQLNPAACTTDVQAFEAALQRTAPARGAAECIACLTEAAEWYRGELLPGYFEGWILPERQRLAERFLHALEQLAASLEAAGDDHGAIQWSRRAVSVDPLREEAHHELIRRLLATGQFDAALRAYQGLERRLAQESGAEPAFATQQLVRTAVIRKGEGPDLGSPASGLLPARLHTSPARPDILPAASLRGTVTFLLAGVDEGPALSGCLEQLRPHLLAHDGKPQAVGGTLQAAFSGAGEALAAALSVQCHATSLAANTPDLPRLALHTAEVPPGTQAQHGLALQHATRLLLSAHPGQILLSEKCALLLRDHLAAGLHLLDLGPYRLHAAARPEHLFQACSSDTPAREFPLPKALPAHDGSLPLPFTRFFGREAEIARLRELLGETVDGGRRTAVDSGDNLPSPDYRLPSTACRLLTLTGPGGSGKTRLAIEVAHQLRATYHGAVWLVPLQDLADAGLIPDKLLDILRLPRSPQVLSLEQAIAFLSRQPSLLVLDNFEHLLADGVSLVRTLLEQVPTLTCLVTSRQRLSLPGEQELPVAPLPVPGEGVGCRVKGVGADEGAPAAPYTRYPTPDTLLQCPSVGLFVDRAQGVRPDFQVTRTNAAAVAAICRRLEGLPLALELAAARAGVLAPAQMLERLSQRFALLAATRPGAAPRHRSLWAALEWSYQLLSPELQQFFARLSVFQGGWTLEAAEAVCGQADSTPDTLHPTPCLASLEHLRQCSLVQVAEVGGELRLRLLESVREYGAEQLGPEEREELSRRHACHYLAVAEEAVDALRGPEMNRWQARLKAEHDNMRAALAWALARQEAEIALRLGGALAWFWCTELYLDEGRERLEASLALPGATARTAPRALALRGVGWLAWHHSDFAAAHAVLRESIAISREVGDKLGLAHTLSVLSRVEHDAGCDLSVMRPACEESLALFREADDLWGIAWASHCLGRVAAEEGDLETAGRLHEEAAALFRAQGDPFALAYPLIGLGHVAERRGDYAAARHFYAECLAIRERYLSQSVARGNALGNLARVEWYLGHGDAAIARLEECVELRRTGGMPHALAQNLYRLGRIAHSTGQPERAAAPLRESLHLFRKHGNREGEALALIALARLAREQQRPIESRSLLRDGLALAQEAANGPATAAALEEIAALLGDQNTARAWTRAARLLGAAAAIREAAGGGGRTAAPVPPPDRARLDQQRAAARAALGEAAFQTAWAAGHALTMERAAAEAIQALEKEVGARAAK